MKIDQTGFYYSDNKIIEEKEHLLVPSICNWAINFLSPYKNKVLYDFGCGIGHYLEKFKEAGYTNLTGFEGMIPENKKFNNIKEQNLTKLFDVSEKGNVICFEVAEHIPAEFTEIFLTNIKNACNNYLLLSWAERGQDWEGHVHCLNNDEVIPIVSAHGFKFLPIETKQAKDAINDYLHFKNIMIFKKI